MLVKRVMRHASDQLDAGEHVVEVAKVFPHGGVAAHAKGLGGNVPQIAAGALLEKIQRKKQSRKTQEVAAPDPSGDASRWPPLPLGYLTLTDRRLVLFDAKGMNDKPGTVQVAFDLDRIDGMSGETTGLAYEFVISFADGSAITIETGRGAKPKPLIEAFERSKGT